MGIFIGLLIAAVIAIGIGAYIAIEIVKTSRRG